MVGASMNNQNRPEPNCACSYNLIQTCKRKSIILPGLAVVVTKADQQVVGLHSLHVSKIVGVEPHSAVLAFRFCPWCGGEFAHVIARGEIGRLEDTE
jgi:hypothetical protein